MDKRGEIGKKAPIVEAVGARGKGRQKKSTTRLVDPLSFGKAEDFFYRGGFHLFKGPLRGCLFRFSRATQGSFIIRQGANEWSLC